ncbi:MAG: thiol reductant ABC exporter subunit CydC [Actinomycetes bacterium]
MMMLAYFLGAFAFIGGIGLTISSGWLITMAASHPPILTLSVAIVMVRFFGIFRSAARYGERLMSHKVVFGRLTQLRVGIYSKIAMSSVASSSHYNSGSAVKTIVDDVERAQEYQLRIKLPHASAVISLITGALLGLWVRPQSLFITVPISLMLLLVVPSRIKSESESTAREIEEMENKYTDLVQSSVHGVAEAAIYGYLDQNLEASKKQEEKLRVVEEKLLKTTYGYATLTNLLIAGSVVGFSALAYLLAQSREIPPVQITMLIFLPLVIFEAITAWYPNLFTAGKLLKSQKSVDQLMSSSGDLETGQIFNAVITSISLKQATVAWGSDFMNPVSFDVSQGELLVVRGRSGSGKSTLAMGLLSLLPYKGSITINAQELRGLSGTNSRIVGTVQKSHIFNTTLRENMKIANQEASDDQIIAALKCVELDQLLSEFAFGLDTVIGEFGRVISGGEAKRLAIARVLLADADVYILDEPTEHLDAALALRLEESISKWLTEKITVVITHSGWNNCDKTLTMAR